MVQLVSNYKLLVLCGDIEVNHGPLNGSQKVTYKIFQFYLSVDTAYYFVLFSNGCIACQPYLTCGHDVPQPKTLFDHCVQKLRRRKLKLCALVYGA